MKVNSPQILSLLTAAIIVSCTDTGPAKRALPNGADGNPKTTNCLALTATSWNSGISSLFQTNCGSCHPGSQTTNYTIYANVTANITKIVADIDSGSMPKGSTLAQGDKDAIHAWVTAGTPESDSTSGTTSGCQQQPTPTPSTPASVTYALNVQPIFSSYCTSCHSASGGQTPALDTLAAVQANYAKSMNKITATNSSDKMPPSGAAIPADQITVLQQWGATTNAPGAFAP